MAQRRQITDADKQKVIERQGLRCFIDNHPIDAESEVQFDHIYPYSEGGPSHIDNIAGVCRRHNREKGALLLGEYRDRLELKKFFEGARKRRLDDLLAHKLGEGSFGVSLPNDRSDSSIKVYFDEGPEEIVLQRCPATGEQYFFALIPARHLRNDTELQPRPLEPDRLWDLCRHLRTHTQLAPSVGRLVGDGVLLFDGQHKAAAQVWNGRRNVDCKVYIEPDVRQMKETNLTAHDKLRQMPFYTSTLLEKYADLAQDDWQAFLETAGPKTESAFATFMRSRAGLTKGDATKRIRSLIHRDILDDSNNRLRDYIAEENRGRKTPLTMYRLEKTFLAYFVAPPPRDDEFETESYHRDEERQNVIRFFNLIVDKTLDQRWDPDAGDAAHKKADRLFSAGALRAWVPFLRDALAPALQLFQAEERQEIFYREMTDADFDVVAQLLDRMLSHQVWEDPDPELNDLRYDNAERAKDMLKRSGLTVGWILGGSS